jgi:hypothetical protein
MARGATDFVNRMRADAGTVGSKRLGMFGHVIFVLDTDMAGYTTIDLIPARADFGDSRGGCRMFGGDGVVAALKEPPFRAVVLDCGQGEGERRCDTRDE